MIDDQSDVMSPYFDEMTKQCSLSGLDDPTTRDTCKSLFACGALAAQAHAAAAAQDGQRIASAISQIGFAARAWASAQVAMRKMRHAAQPGE